MDHRTMIGQDISYKQDPRERTYSFVIYVQRSERDVLITSDDGWYGVKTVSYEDEAAAHRAFLAVVADPKPELQRIYGESCEWFEAYPPERRVHEGSHSALPGDDEVLVRVTKPRGTKRQVP